MTNKELQEKLKEYPDWMDVYIASDYNYDGGLVYELIDEDDVMVIQGKRGGLYL